LGCNHCSKIKSANIEDRHRHEELGAAPGGVDEVAVSMAARRVPMKARNNRALAKALETCIHNLKMFKYGPDAFQTRRCGPDSERSILDVP
jgi:hypothetical protein